MKTSVDLPDELYRRVKVEAVLRGKTFRELVVEGLTHILEAPAKRHPKSSMSARMKRARGVIDSGIPDLGSNPKHLAGFCRNTRQS